MKFILGIIFGICVLIFMAQNPQVVDITFLAWSFSISRAIMYLLFFTAGFLSGAIIIGLKRKKRDS